jgi:hypothetical protein
MRYLKDYDQYLKEEFVNQTNAASKLEAFLQGKLKVVNDWFQKGLFPNSELIDNTLSKFTDKMSKNIVFNFTDKLYYYQVVLAIRIEDFDEGNFKKAFLKIKKFAMDPDNPGVPGENYEDMLIDVWDSNNPDNNPDGAGQIDITNFKPEFIQDKIGAMAETSQAPGTQDPVQGEEGSQIQEPSDIQPDY